MPANLTGGLGSSAITGYRLRVDVMPGGMTMSGTTWTGKTFPHPYSGLQLDVYRNHVTISRTRYDSSNSASGTDTLDLEAYGTFHNTLTPLMYHTPTPTSES